MAKSNRINQHDLKISEATQETSSLKQEIKSLMSRDPVLHNIKNHFISRGVERFKIDLVLEQAFKDKEQKEKFLSLGKKRKMISLIFFVLFGVGVFGWFHIYHDWITYFAGANLILFLFFMQQSSSFKGRAAVFE